MSFAHGLEIERHVDDQGALATMAGEVRDGLRGDPKSLPSKYFYDERGSRLFERITELPEYYLTRAEQEILEREADTLTGLTRPCDLIELGPGSAKKTRLLIEAALRSGELRRYVPLEVSVEIAESMARGLVRRYPELKVHAVVGDFVNHLEEIPDGGRRLVALLGSTIGNFARDDAVELLSRIAGVLRGGESGAAESYLLLGIDLVKDHAMLEAAYNDSQGVTAEFNKNILNVLNLQLNANFDLSKFEHYSFYNPKQQQIETHLRSLAAQSVWLDDLEMQVDFADGELLHTEISSKYTRDSVRAMIEAAGLELRHWFTDPDERFALSLSRLAAD